MARLYCVVFLAAALLAACTQQVAAIFAEPESLDVVSPMQNEQAFRDTMRCVFSREDYQDCDANSVTIKYTMWRLIEKGCGSCSDDEQKVYGFMAHLSKTRPTEWQGVLNKFDPQGDSRRKNADQWRQHGVAV